MESGREHTVPGPAVSGLIASALRHGDSNHWLVKERPRSSGARPARLHTLRSPSEPPVCRACVCVCVFVCVCMGTRTFL